MTTLFLGNKNYSSWSMRPWLALRWGDIAFDERVLQLGPMGYGKSKQPSIAAISPSGRVPALDLGAGALIWDSLAICEWAAEQTPALWPEAAADRARARAVACEMHAGFAALRKEAPMNVRRRAGSRAWSEDARHDIARIDEMWRDLRGRFGGPYLFGARSIADAFYAPVATRFRTYAVALSPAAQGYCDVVLADAAFREWEAAAIAEVWTAPATDEI